MALILGGGFFLSVIFVWIGSRTFVQTPTPELPSVPPPIPFTSLRDLREVPISEIIEPAYSNPIEPFKTFKVTTQP
jgi:hypothetical protein